MYIKECKWCKKEIIVDKQPQFALHICNCDFNPNKKLRDEKNSLLYKGKLKVDRIKLLQNCPKCNKEFEIKITNSELERNKYRKFCSRKCANSKQWSDEHKKKLSESCKNSEKVKVANKIITEGRKNSLEKNRLKKIKKPNIIFTCLYCGKEGIDKNRHKDRKYHFNCSKKASGGIRKGSSRGKCGWYKGYWCDSSYELVFVIYCLDHNIKIQRNKKGYEYVYRGKKHIYYPDFRVNGILTEIKNFRSELTDEKLKSVNEKIDIIYRDTIQPYIKYVEEKYGKDYLKLYKNKIE
jgi:endogenous inhibitor of DNA gyrase (YacG/DUF329 family)